MRDIYESTLLVQFDQENIEYCNKAIVLVSSGATITITLYQPLCDDAKVALCFRIFRETGQIIF